MPTPSFVPVLAIVDADTGKLTGFKQDGIPGKVLPLDALNDALAATEVFTWANRGTGSYVGQVRRFDLSSYGAGHNPCLEAVWNGTSWVPRSGEQTIYDLPTPVLSGAAALTATCVPPVVTLPGGMMGVNGEIEIATAAYLTLAAGTLSARTLTMGFGGSGNNLLNDTVNLHRRVSLFRHIKNVNATNQQVIIQRAANEFQEAVSANTDPQTATQDTTIDRTIQGNFSWTSSSNIQAAIIKHRVVWRGM